MHDNYQTFVGADFFKRQKNQATKKIEIFLVPNIEKQEKKVPPKVKKRKNLSVYFDSGDHKITEVQKEQIQILVNQFIDKTALKFDVIGFADDVGEKYSNLALSEDRAKNVVAYLTSLGINPEQIVFKGGGVVKGDLAKHQKRRVEIRISD